MTDSLEYSPCMMRGVLVLNFKYLSNLTLGLLFPTAQPILKVISSSRLFGHCPQEWGTQYTRTFGFSGLSTSSTQLGACACISPAARQQVGWAHHIHPCCLQEKGLMHWPTSNLWNQTVPTTYFK